MLRRSRRRSSRLLIKILLLVSPLLIGIIVFLIYKNGFLNIKGFDVRAENIPCAGENELRDAVHLLGQNFFFMNKEKITQDLKIKFICIRDVSISRFFPNKVEVRIAGRNPAVVLAILKEQIASTSALIQDIATPSASQVQDMFLVDSEGVVFAKAADNPNMPKIYITDLSISLGTNLSNTISNALKILDKVKALGIVTQDNQVSEQFFVVNTNTMPKIVFRLDKNVDVQLASLQLILNKAKIDLKELEFIDLRFDKPIVRFVSKDHG